MSKTKINKQKLRKLKISQKNRKIRAVLQEDKTMEKLKGEYYKEVRKMERNNKSEELTSDQIRDKLEHNHRILDALEQEYLKDEANKAKLNKDLEEQGATTPKEKVELLKEMGEDISKEYAKIQEEKQIIK